MATLDELELRLRALEQAQAAEPTSYYTSIFSGEEMDQRLTAAGVLGVASTPQEALAALGAAVQENELDNAYFVGGGIGYGVFPVNQKGKTQYTELGPMFDRWRLVHGAGHVIELTPDGLTILGGTPYSMIRSSLRRTLSVGATYTLTVLFRNGTVVSNVITVPNEDNPSELTPITPGGTYMRLFGPKTFEIVGITGDKTPEIELIKLEQGNRQTAAYQKSDGKWSRLPQNLSYEQTLANCQAYQIELNYRRLQNPTIGTVVRGPGSWYVAIPLPTTMRVAPAIKIERGTPTVECQDGAFQVSQLTPLSTTSSMALFVLKFSGGSPSTASSGTLYVAGTGTGADAPSVILDANL